MEERLKEGNGVGSAPAPEDPYKEVKARLAKFFLSLIQAFLRTGYYTTDHPEAEKARVGLYEDFQELLKKGGEVTFLVRDDPEGMNIQIEGVVPAPQDLHSLMLHGMAEMYIPKIAKFLERKDLVSLTLKSAMSETEFTRFVDVMSEPAFVDTREESNKERFNQTLRDKGIINVSYIFNEEVLATRRGIPWRAQIAISRLKKDFRMVPLYYDLDAESLKQVRCQIIQEVARPIQNIGVIYPILMNSDLAETEEFKESEIDKEIIASLSDKILIGISKTLLKKASAQGKAEPHGEKLPKLAKEITLALNQREIVGRDAILEAYFKEKLISLEDLPEGTQRKIKMQYLMNKFLRESDTFLERFDKIQEGDKYIKAARYLRGMIPELIRRDRYEEMLKIITLMSRHVNDREHLSVHAGETLEKIKKGKIPAVLKGKFLTGNREICQAIAPIFHKLQEASVPHLFAIVKESQDQWVMKTACEILMQIDPAAINTILSELEKKAIATGFATRIIRVLSEVTLDQSIEPLAKTLVAYMGHENPHLREEALEAYYKLVGDEGEKLYLDLLDDPDIGVQKKAIQCLSRIKSQKALERFLEMLQKTGDLDSYKDMQVAASLFSALGFYGNISWPKIGRLEDFLLKTLDDALNPGPLKFFKKKRTPLGERAISAVFESLGKIGTEKSRPLLQKVEKQQDSIWRKKAEEALRKIAEVEGRKESG